MSGGDGSPAQLATSPASGGGGPAAGSSPANGTKVGRPKQNRTKMATDLINMFMASSEEGRIWADAKTQLRQCERLRKDLQQEMKTVDSQGPAHGELSKLTRKLRAIHLIMTAHQKHGGYSAGSLATEIFTLHLIPPHPTPTPPHFTPLHPTPPYPTRQDPTSHYPNPNPNLNPNPSTQTQPQNPTRKAWRLQCPRQSII